MEEISGGDQWRRPVEEKHLGAPGKVRPLLWDGRVAVKDSTGFLEGLWNPCGHWTDELNSRGSTKSDDTISYIRTNSLRRETLSALMMNRST